MSAARSLAALLVALLVALALAAPHTHLRTRRQLADDNTLQPIDDAASDEQAREKRKLEGVTQAKFGIKNAVLGFVFGNGATLKVPRAQNLLDTRRTLNSSYRRTSRPSAATQDKQTLLRTRSDLTSVDIRGNPGQSNTLEDQKQDIGHNLRAYTPDTSRRLSTRASRQATAKPADDIPVFDRNKVSLDFPGNLFGPSVSLLIRTTKIIGDVIQNSAVRYQSFLRLFRPLFRGPFEIKGLDPPTTTTTTTTSTPRTTTTARTASPAMADNEINRKR